MKSIKKYRITTHISAIFSVAVSRCLNRLLTLTNAKRLNRPQALPSLSLNGFMAKPFVPIFVLMLVLAGILPIYGQSFDWFNIATDSPRPSARSGHGMVYDPIHQKVILFGGSDSTGTRNDVWEFDTATRHWTNVTPSSGAMPVPRSNFGMALDENRGVVVVYGGNCGTNCVEYGNVAIVGDTWEWNTTTRTWRKGPNTIPIFVGLRGSALAYDPTRRQVIAFSGKPYWCPYCENRTWAWDGTSWTDITPAISPDARYDHDMVTDTDRNRIVMFGPFEDTWEWDGSQWIPVGQTGPHPTWRWGVKMAYDKVRKKTILFGGSNQYTAFNETWEWDGTTWTQLFPLHSPPGRGYTSLVYDESQNVLVMFGGDRLTDDIWISGPEDSIPPVSTALTNVAPNPAGWNNSNVTVTLNAADDAGGSGVQQIVYAASGAQTIASTAVNGATVSFPITAEGVTTISYFARDKAGNTQAAHTLVLKIDKTPPSLTVPSGISADAPTSSGVAVSYEASASDALDPSPTLSCSPASGSTFAIGATQVSCTATDGADNSVSSSFTVWVTRDLGFDWYNIPTDSPRPSPRTGHGMVYDPIHAKVILFGGGNATTLFNDIWEFDTATRHWTNVTPLSGPAPAPRSGFGIAYDESRGVVVLYGGYCGSQCSGSPVDRGTIGDTWEWNTAIRSWRLAPNSAPTFDGPQGSALAYDPTRRQVIRFGGRAVWNRGVNSTWAWNGTVWTNVTPAVSPTPTFDHAMSLDPDRNRIVLFGASTEETWEWDGTAWTRVALTGSHPSWRFGPTMAYDKSRHRTVLFGGSNQFIAFDETWEWNGIGWTQLSPLHRPPGRGYTAMVFDESQNVLVVFGGNGITDDTWISGPADGVPPVTEASASPLSNNAGWNNENVTVNLSATDNSGGSGVKEIVYSVSGAQTISQTIVNGASATLTITAEGLTTVTFFARDNAGNTEAPQTITIRVDKTVPMISNMPSNQTVEATGSNGAAVFWNSPTVTDNLDPNVSVICSHSSGDTFAIGTAEVQCTSTDQAGNSSPASFEIAVRDTTSPVISNLPADVIVTATSADGAVVSWDSPTSVDLVDGSVPVICMPASGSAFAHGMTIVTCTAKDSRNNIDSKSFKVSVLNAPPTANAGGPYQVGEGGAVNLSGSGTDVEGTALTYDWDLDDNGSFETTGQNPIFSAVGLNGPTSRTVRLRVTDGAGLSAINTATVIISNAAPTLNSVSGPLNPQAVNTTVNVSFNYTDPAISLEQYTVTINWGDGITDNSTSHVYTAAGVYRIKATVSDNDGGNSNEAIYEYVVVYNPDGGFVTGGGWIMSPAGAYTPDPALMGKATFGFVSKYQKGANQPTGNTEFQFHAGNFRFKSDSYEWLVIAGAKAQYKGTGSVNGVPGYSFILTATDGQINGGGGADKFRIKIWNSGGVVYDNVLGGADQINEASPQAIGGGSIVIQSDK